MKTPPVVKTPPVFVYDISADSDSDQDVPRKEPSPEPNQKKVIVQVAAHSSNTNIKKRSRQSVAEYYHNLFESQPKVVKCVETVQEKERRKRISDERENKRKLELEKDRITAIQNNIASLKEKEIQRNNYYSRIGQQFNQSSK